MERHCAHCGAAVFECMGTVKAGDFDEFCRGVRPGNRIRELCGPCATFYAFLRPGWRWLIRFAGVRHPIPVRKIVASLAARTGIRFFVPV
ncbi:MAG TPA: hypothetical protein VFP46_00815, partial [Candidatus Paceibacterota bacterium]|nr:hypothetical protein [Candidatus Paceibacterota bacterium]